MCTTVHRIQLKESRMHWVVFHRQPMAGLLITRRRHLWGWLPTGLMLTKGNGSCAQKSSDFRVSQENIVAGIWGDIFLGCVIVWGSAAPNQRWLIAESRMVTPYSRESRHIQLYTVTLDNTSNNTTTCTTIESLHARRQYRPWSAADNQLPWVYQFWFTAVIFKLNNMSTRCLEHVVNLTNVDVMRHITKIVAVENATAIWEYDPDLLNNCVLGGSLDVIAAVRTIAIKVCFPILFSVLPLNASKDPGLWTVYRVFRKASK